MTSGGQDGFRRLFESMLGTEYLGPLDEIARAIGVDIDDPSSWAELEARWESMRPQVETLRAHDDRAFDQVELVFQAVIARDRDVFEPAVLATYDPSIRMLIATRVIEGQVDNGGWPAVFYNGVDDHLPAAIEGFRLLGLAAHAELAEQVKAHGWTEPDDSDPYDPAWDRFDAAWRELPDAEDARAQYIRDHADAFPA